MAKRFIEPETALATLGIASQKAAGNLTLSLKIENERGLISRDQKKYDDAKRYHLMARTKARNDTLTLYFLGLAELLTENEGAGTELIKRAATASPDDVAAQTLKPLWGDVIQWTHLALESGGKETKEGKLLWSRIDANIRSPYMRQTILAHVDCVRNVTNRAGNQSA